jgi:hypothetical protein
MKKTITTLVLALSMSAAFSQNAGDSLIVKFDTSVFKNVIAIIQKQLDSKAASNYVLEALSKYELIATKPKEIKK